MSSAVFERNESFVLDRPWQEGALKIHFHAFGVRSASTCLVLPWSFAVDQVKKEDMRQEIISFFKSRQGRALMTEVAAEFKHRLDVSPPVPLLNKGWPYIAGDPAKEHMRMMCQCLISLTDCHPGVSDLTTSMQ